MKITVDYDVCASTGSCMQICPEVFEVRSDGYLYVLQEEPPEELRDRSELSGCVEFGRSRVSRFDWPTSDCLP